MEEKRLSEKIIEIDLERLRPFENHPFKISDDGDMKELMESISLYGILDPIIVRPRQEGYYEIISGHRRTHAAKKLGFTKVPVLIRVMKDYEAVISMVDANLQRNSIRPSEKATAYKMKYQAILSERKKHNGGQFDNVKKGERTIQILGREIGESSKQIQRYLKIADLNPKLLEKLDSGNISFNPAYELSFLTKKQQELVNEAIDYTQSAPSLSQAQRMKELAKNDKLNYGLVVFILSEVKKSDVEQVIFKTKQLHKFFPHDASVDEMKTKILDILNDWKKAESKKKHDAIFKKKKTESQKQNNEPEE